jgi:hypothetical protein
VAKTISKFVMVDVVVVTTEFNIPYVVGCVKGFGIMASTHLGSRISYGGSVPKEWYVVEEAPRWMFDDKGYFVAQIWENDRNHDQATRFVYAGPLERWDGNEWVPVENEDEYSFRGLIFPEK